ncbi:MAG TPA: hypothetical protein ENJ35_06870 [Gammaproteobacteria bacterium]|nr:hypothetical protein [Gammaproteobacteria bacterium]
MNHEPQQKPMRTSLIRIGSEVAVLLDQAMLDLIDATPETAFKVSTDGRVIVLTPVRHETGDQTGDMPAH